MSGKKVITLGLSNQSIDRAIKELEAYKRELSTKIQQFTERLALIGCKEASVRFTTAIYDGVNDVSVSLDGEGNHFVIIADGKAVAFIEFGSGVTHNTSEPYPNPRPSGIVGIGEFGEGKGKRKAWFYYGEPGSNGEIGQNGLIKTRGNPAAMPMWYATEEMRHSIAKLVKEVFG